MARIKSAINIVNVWMMGAWTMRVMKTATLGDGLDTRSGSGGK
jgi:hypothetical protein